MLYLVYKRRGSHLTAVVYFAILRSPLCEVPVICTSALLTDRMEINIFQQIRIQIIGCGDGCYFPISGPTNEINKRYKNSWWYYLVPSRFDMWLVTLSICQNPWWVSFYCSDYSFFSAASISAGISNIWFNGHGDSFYLLDLFLASGCHYLYDPTTRVISSHLTKANK